MVLSLGLLFLLGPTVIELILYFFTWFDPFSAWTIMFLIMELLANIVLAIRYKNNAVMIDNDYESVDEQKRKNEQNKRWWKIAIITGIAGVALIFLNQLIIQIYQGWRWFVVGNKESIAILRYIGGILFTAGLCFFAGKAYQAKKTKISEENQQPTPQSWEGYSASPVQVVRRPDDVQVANWQQPVPVWKQPVQQPMPVVPYQQTMQQVQYEQRPMAKWQQENIWYEVKPESCYEYGYESTQDSWEREPSVRYQDDGWESEPQPACSSYQYQRPNTYGKGKIVDFPGCKPMLDEKDLEIHLPKSAWRKLFGKRRLKFS